MADPTSKEILQEFINLLEQNASLATRNNLAEFAKDLNKVALKYKKIIDIGTDIEKALQDIDQNSAYRVIEKHAATTAIVIVGEAVGTALVGVALALGAISAAPPALVIVGSGILLGAAANNIVGYLHNHGITLVPANIDYSNAPDGVEIYGTIRGDTLRGTQGDDTIHSGAGSDLIRYSGGNDTVDGGLDGLLWGPDIMNYNSSNDSILADFTEDGDITVIHETGIDELSDIEQIVGTGKDDEFYINGISRTIDGGNGTDTLYISEDYTGRTTTIDLSVELVELIFSQDAGGGTLSSTFEVSNIENVYGSDGRDTITGDEEDNELHGGQENDTIKGGNGDDILFGDEGDDIFESENGDGNDTIDGGEDNDKVIYGEDQPIIITFGQGENGEFSVFANSGQDKDTITNVEVIELTSTQENIIFATDELAQTSFSTSLLIDAQGSNDILDFSQYGQRILMQPSFNAPNGGAPQVDIGSGVLVRGFEGIRGTSHEDILRGGNEDNILIGGAGHDTLIGGGGDDILIGDFYGKNGDVTFGEDLLYGDKKDKVTMTIDGHTLEGGIDFDTYYVTPAMQNFGSGDGFGLTIYELIGIFGETKHSGGNESVDIITDSDSNGQIFVDTFRMPSVTFRQREGKGQFYSQDEKGNRFHAWKGEDDGYWADGVYFDKPFTGGGDSFYITYSGSTGKENTTPFLYDDAEEGMILFALNGVGSPTLPQGSASSGSTFKSLSASNIDTAPLQSSTLGFRFANLMNKIDTDDNANTITGTDNDDYIQSKGGDDVIRAGLGNDVAEGGEGDDEIHGGDGYDDLQGEGGNDKLYGDDGDDLVVGGAGDDELEGGNGLDDLRGGDGNDIMTGGKGNDIIKDSAGADSYHFSKGDGHDSIEDQGFEATDIDTLFLHGFLPDEVKAVFQGSDKAELILTFTGTDDQILLISNFSADTPQYDKFIEHIQFDDGTVWDFADIVATYVPTAQDDSGFSVAEHVVLDIPISELLANDTDLDSDTISLVSVIGNEDVSVEIVGDVVRFQSNENTFGNLSFDYVISDNKDGQDTGTVSVDVARVNDAPTAVDDLRFPDAPGLYAVKDTVHIISTFDVLINDQDPDGDQLTVTSVEGGVNGTATLALNYTTTDAFGQVTEYGDIILFTATPGYTGPASFTYTASDGEYESTATAHLDVVYEVVGTSDTVDVVADSPTTILAETLLANDYQLHSDHDPKVTLVFGARNGQASLDDNGNILFTPDDGFTGQASFAYLVEFGPAKRGVHVNVNVGDENVAPVVGDVDLGSIALNTPLTFHASDLLSNSSDADGDQLLVGGIKLIDPDTGTLVDNNNGSYTFTPATDFSADDIAISFIVFAGPDQVTGKALIDVKDSNQAPITNGDDLIFGTPQSDIINALGGNDIVWGRDDDDILLGSGGDDTLHGEGGNDILSGGNDNDQLFGEEGNDKLYGGTSKDLLDGGAGNDLLLGGFGDDSLNGGDGSDILGGGKGNDTLRGGDAADSLFGNIGNDQLFGEEGNDKLYGGTGKDQLDGGAGNDLLLGGLGDDSLTGGNGKDVLGGGDGDDRLFGGLGNDSLFGNAGNDTLFGQEGNDNLYGGAGKDSLTGGGGKDLLHGNAGNDLLFGNAGDDTLFGDAGNDKLYGGAGSDIIGGGNGGDLVYGNAGNDFLFGNAGNDALIGGAGNDSLYGGNGTDSFYFANGFGNDILFDFENNGLEKINLIGVDTITSFADLTAGHVSQNAAGNVVITDDADTITIQNYSIDDLDASDFLF